MEKSRVPASSGARIDGPSSMTASGLRAALCLVILAASLSGCAGSEHTTYRLERADPYAEVAASCAVLAANGSLRDDVGAVGNITVTATSAEQRIDSTTGSLQNEIEGETAVTAPNAERYEWSCLVHMDDSGRRLVAEIVRFAPTE